MRSEHPTGCCTERTPSISSPTVKASQSLEPFGSVPLLQFQAISILIQRENKWPEIEFPNTGMDEKALEWGFGCEYTGASLSLRMLGGENKYYHFL